MTTFRSANPFDELPKGVKFLLISNVVVFFVMFLLSPRFPGLYHVLALQPMAVIKKFWIWQLFTYSFLHGGGWHLFINMFVLWMFGTHVERTLGTPAFFRYYFICVLGAALTQSIIAPNGIVVGASGGIYGILMAFGLLFPDAVIYLFFFFPLRAIQAVIFIGILALISAAGSGVGSQVAHFAHLGGMLTGFLMFKFPAWQDRFKLWKAERLFRNPKGRRSHPAHDPKEDVLRGEVDRILDKISSQGIESLTPEEHEAMKRYAKKKG